MKMVYHERGFKDSVINSNYAIVVLNFFYLVLQNKFEIKENKSNNFIKSLVYENEPFCQL